jgi:hypothetical protein
MESRYEMYSTNLNNYLEDLFTKGVITSDGLEDVKTYSKKEIFSMKGNLEKDIKDKIIEWEKIVSTGDDRLYSLGLRHALDIISGENATD